MKTTIDIPDPLLAEARRVAEGEGTTLRALVEAGLREVLKSRKAGAPRFELKLVTFPGDGLRDDVEDGSWDRIRDLAYEGRGA